ncbi:MAG TPA: hypothetical protein VI279_13690 [Rhodocyclaceae bacterium]
MSRFCSPPLQHPRVTTAQRGFTLVSAIFILVVLVSLGAAIVSVATSSGVSSALDVQGTQAYQAARAGIEWSVYQLQATPAYNFGQASSDPNTRDCNNAGGSLGVSFVPPAPRLSDFTVTVSCNAKTDASGAPTVYEITVTACNQPDGTGKCPGTASSLTYVERKLEVKL